MSLCYLVEVSHLSACFLSSNHLPDNSGHIIVWSLGLCKPLQMINASFASSIMSLCWINTSILKDGTTDENALPAFTIGFGTGIVAIYRQSSETVRKLA